jgi:hypothetical protein
MLSTMSGCPEYFWNFQNGWRCHGNGQNGRQYKKSLKIQKLTDFNGNRYLQGVRHAAPYGDHFGLLWWPF